MLALTRPESITARQKVDFVYAIQYLDHSTLRDWLALFPAPDAVAGKWAAISAYDSSFATSGSLLGQPLRSTMSTAYGSLPRFITAMS